MQGAVQLLTRGCALVAAITLHGVAARSDDPTEALFVRRIAPLLRERCAACHGAVDRPREGGFAVTDRDGLMRGGDSGQPAIFPGSAARSPLHLAISRASADWSPMPPKEAEALSPEQVGWIREWIDAGAPWPSAERIREIQQANAELWVAEDGILVATSGGLSAEWTSRRYKPESLWAYQPVVKPIVDATGPAAIDELLNQRMPKGLEPAPSADARRFIRRATFDLTGLPPSPEEVDQVEADHRRNSDAAVSKLIDRLLASEHYGEQMARHWLDVVRYADSSGFANDFERGGAWRYRDYVIRAFQRDMPYNQFIVEQIAGDELDPHDPEKIVATGFLRMGPWELTGMEVAKVARQRFLDDVTNSVGESFLAHSLQCARCHDHKFDPVPTRDYYSIQAVFATTQLAERAAPFLPLENTNGFDERRFLEARRQEYLAELAELDAVLLKNAEHWFVDRGKDPAKWRAVLETVRARGPKGARRPYADLFSAARNELLKAGVSEDEFPPKLIGFGPLEFGRERVARKGMERLNWELDRYEPFALAVYSGRTPDVKAVYAPTRVPANRMTEGELEETAILTGGDPFSLGEKTAPGVLSALLGVSRPDISRDMEGRRLAFARWVADPRNSLTARAIVNRVWMWHFGQPLAGNPNNFGSTGKRPTHPELLDWLAATFVEQGWSFKRLHREIMLTAAYRRSSTHPRRDLLDKLDPHGTSYAQFSPRRLTAEELHDAMLTASGELNRTVGGIPNRPEIHPEIAMQPRQVMGTFASAWIPNPRPEQRHRRSIYALKLRGLIDPALEVFNAPSPDFSCERRTASTVAPQAFALFNGRTSYARSLAFAANVLRDASLSEADVVDRCFLRAFARRATDDERAACVNHWRGMTAVHRTTRIVVSEPPRSIRRDAVEENTGEKFSFNEVLHANAEFVPDVRPQDVGERVRGLADVCLALFNANEFAYID